jgi:hypothetical protein
MALLRAVQPGGNLTADPRHFNNQDANGDWHLEITDNTHGTEARLQGWSLTFTSGDPRAQSNSDGIALFDHLKPGSYAIREVPQDGWVETRPPFGNVYRFTVLNGEQQRSLFFGNFQPTPATPSAPQQPLIATPAPGPTERYAARLIQDLFGAADSTTAAAVAQSLDQGASLTQVVRDLLRSEDYRVRRVQRLYQALLHRRARGKELRRALDLLARGGTIEQVEAEVLASDDYFRRRGGGTGAGFLEALSEDLLGQQVNPGVVAEFAGQMAGAGARLQVTTRVLRLAAVDQRWVLDLFRHFLHQPPNGEEMQLYSGLLQGKGSEEQVLAAVLSSPRYAGSV